MYHFVPIVTTPVALKGQCIVYEAIQVFKVHVILLDPKKIMRFIVDVTYTPDKECLVDITKASITSKAILTESQAGIYVKLDMAIHSLE